jgi:hypothetical protein
MAEDEYVLGYDGVYDKVQRPSNEPETMIDYGIRSTEGSGEGYNSRFANSNSSVSTESPAPAASLESRSETPSSASWWRHLLGRSSS